MGHNRFATPHGTKTQISAGAAMPRRERHLAAKKSLLSWLALRSLEGVSTVFPSPFPPICMRCAHTFPSRLSVQTDAAKTNERPTSTNTRPCCRTIRLLVKSGSSLVLTWCLDLADLVALGVVAVAPAVCDTDVLHHDGYILKKSDLFIKRPERQHRGASVRRRAGARAGRVCVGCVLCRGGEMRYG